MSCFVYAVLSEAGSLGAQVEVPQELFQAAQVMTVEQAIAQARRISFPVMIKASAGGGGKGIRRAEDDDEESFAQLFNQVRAEVPGSPVFIMKCAENVRHLEVQILADEYGEAISVFGRDCTLQRRHQKIIEEAPITIVQDSALLREMETKARLLAKLVGYQSAGTVEYIYDLDKLEYYFLELNPRLQVEHPCTGSCLLTVLNRLFFAVNMLRSHCMKFFTRTLK
jgi:acetyl-CoA carboxylase/biotin carboxylase 1